MNYIPSVVASPYPKAPHRYPLTFLEGRTLKIKVLAWLHPSGIMGWGWVGLVSWPPPASRGCLHAWARGPFLRLQCASFRFLALSSLIFPIRSFLCPSSKAQAATVCPPRKSVSTSHSQGTSAKFLWPQKGTESWVQGRGTQISLGATILLLHLPQEVSHDPDK